MLRNFHVEHYRAFLAKTTIDIRPLTLLFGYNNSGKSALIRSSASLMKSLSGKPGVPWTDDVNLTRGATFQELTSSLLSGKTAYFNCGLELKEGPLTSASWTLRQEGKTTFVSDCTFVANTAEVSAHIEGALVPDKNYAYTYKICSGTETATARIVFNGLRPRFVDAPQDALAAKYAELAGALPTSDLSVQWMGASRLAPPRQHRVLNSWTAPFSQDGVGTFDFLVTESEGGKLGPVGEEVSKWFETNLKRRLKIDSNGDRYDLKIEPFGELAADLGRASVPLADAGEGLSQVLPVLVALARARQGGTYAPRFLCVEEPESHLHPRFHAALAEAFYTAASGENPPLLLAETHSENLLLQLQLAVAQKKISQDRIAIYWVRQDESGRSRADFVSLDEMGKPHGDWPPTVFGEDLRLSRELMAIQRSNQTNPAG